MPAENTQRKQRGRPFIKGQSGNPNGRPKGARNRATLAVEALLDGEAESITRIAIQKAKEGDSAALRLCLERILPARKERSFEFAMPSLCEVADAPKALSAITDAVSKGDLTISEASELARLVDSYVRSVEASDLDKRLRAIEQAMTK